ncbi:DUF4178 domain-containing protein [Pacificoceanicola onchidii]|uniref:DUF4178 domain-containing protein n=1 Tax=Pacificoceanicola onchidii TaxID=2562685 RepID=UPI0010A69072|nr:DUF4178 domain-containing protein [Pacificoceanicola onchidii]
MTRAATLEAINCTACGAGLDILGGGRVTTHVCGYCGTELDALHGYRALRQFSDMPRPNTPFTLGMKGVIKGIEWTIIGTLGHREDYGGKTWEWVEHQLFSETHGYAWLTVEDGHLVYSRRLRGTPQGLWMSEYWVENAESAPTASYNGESYKYLQTTKSRLTFVEGEFTWSPTVGDVTTTISAMCLSGMLDFSETGTEREIYKSEYLPQAEVKKSFGLKSGDLKAHGVHALQPYKAGENTGFVAFVSGVAAACCLIIAITFISLPGYQVLAPTEIGLRALPRDVTFDLRDTDKLATIKISANVSNAWSYFEMELTDPEDVPVFEAGRTVEYYYGRQDGESWSEGNRSSSLTFRPPAPGTYTLTIDQPEAGIWGNGRNATAVTVSAREGQSSGMWLLLLAFGFGILSAVTYGKKFMHRARRWSHSDWSDD